jgi:hypothetical protein
MESSADGWTESWIEKVSGWMLHVVLILVVTTFVIFFAGVFADAINDVLWVAAAYRSGYGNKRVRRWQQGGDGRELRARARVLAYVPLALVLIGVERLIDGAPGLDAPWLLSVGFSSPVLVRAGVMFAAFLMGMRARTDTFQARDFARELLYGPTRWLIPALVACMAIHIGGVEDMLLASAMAVLACAMIAWQREPMFLTRRGIAAWRVSRPLMTES